MPAASSDFPAEPHRSNGPPRPVGSDVVDAREQRHHDRAQPADTCLERVPHTSAPHERSSAHGHAPHDQGDHAADHPRPVADWEAGTLSEAGDLLRALAAPVRIAIVLQLRTSEACVHDLVDALGVAQPLISQHLRVLKSAGVVHGERHGREVLYRLVDEHLAHIVVDAVTHAEEVSGTRPGRRVAAARIAEHSSGQETETG